MATTSHHSEELAGLLANVTRHVGCHLLPPAGQAVLPEDLTLPGDLRRFHELCGGAVLFEGAPFEWRVSGPRELVPASPRLLGPHLARQVAEQYPTDVTNGCYVFAESGPGSTDVLVVVDLHPSRAGRYYQAFWDSYGLIGQMPILAHSLPELLHDLLATQGLREAHPAATHGDAYDNAGAAA